MLMVKAEQQKFPNSTTPNAVFAVPKPIPGNITIYGCGYLVQDIEVILNADLPTVSFYVCKYLVFFPVMKPLENVF